ncbi:unnamed protein product [Bursaphelenchus okinawaensis]|uniref:Uncharacterized protein n=1 Tax=Bursaphelenchus okinawaensis TaxID=465554 RepID=A0A811LNQ0_9BILA|nr:unnamed protein product [Bursaphelenchus okinawaensis]CAG9127201.1 unnamed protein product [Bursaphelenchus okinawaensis]
MRCYLFRRKTDASCSPPLHTQPGFTSNTHRIREETSTKEKIVMSSTAALEINQVSSMENTGFCSLFSSSSVRRRVIILQHSYS